MESEYILFCSNFFIQKIQVREDESEHNNLWKEIDSDVLFANMQTSQCDD